MMTQGLMIFFGAILALITIVAFFHIVGSLFAKSVATSRAITEEMQPRAFWLGLVNSLVLAAIVVIFFGIAERIRFPGIFLPGALVFLYLAVGIIFGLTGIVQLLGERLFPDLSPLRRNSYSSGLLALACLTPFVGWWGLLPYLVILSFGSFFVGQYQAYREKRAAKIAESTE
jgi:hypothetical protein